MSITDRYERKHDYLRISLTDVCNLRCRYCMPDEAYDFMPAGNLMQPFEIEAIVKRFVALGVTKVRLTGGEPLARTDFDDIAGRLAKLPVKMALTTNATLLHRHIDTLAQTGISSLNISLDTLSPAKYLALTRRDRFVQTMDNIRLALNYGLRVKVNMVVMKGVNEHEIPDFIAWTKEQPLEVRFIEFMPFAGNRWTGDRVFAKADILAMIRQQYAIQELPAIPHATSTRYAIQGHAGRFAIISTMSAPFCSSCNRMRLTADGRMKNCLFSTDETDLLTALRSGIPLEPLIRENIMNKAEKLGGQFGDLPFEQLEGDSLTNRSMISIGG